MIEKNFGFWSEKKTVVGNLWIRMVKRSLLFYIFCQETYETWNTYSLGGE